MTGDGLPGDPVNLVLIGTRRQLQAAFTAAGWSEADRLGLASSWHMIWAFVFDSSYPTAPFSTLYLFGRGQDIGFQKAIDNSPRKRHHIRFWALSLARAEATAGNSAASGSGTEPLAHSEHVLWIGAGTKDTGLSLTQLTFQITHATDSDTNAERDYIIAELRQNRGDQGCEFMSGRPTSVRQTCQSLHLLTVKLRWRAWRWKPDVRPCLVPRERCRRCSPQWVSPCGLPTTRDNVPLERAQSLPSLNSRRALVRPILSDRSR